MTAAKHNPHFEHKKYTPDLVLTDEGVYCCKKLADNGTALYVDFPAFSVALA